MELCPEFCLEQKENHLMKRSITDYILPLSTKIAISFSLIAEIAGITSRDFSICAIIPNAAALRRYS